MMLARTGQAGIKFDFPCQFLLLKSFYKYTGNFLYEEFYMGTLIAHIRYINDFGSDPSIKDTGEKPVVIAGISEIYSIYSNRMMVEDFKKGTLTVFEDLIGNDGQPGTNGKYDTQIVISDGKIDYHQHKSDEENFDRSIKDMRQKIIDWQKQLKIEISKALEEWRKIEAQVKTYGNFTTKVIDENHYTTEKDGVTYDEVFNDSQIIVTNTKTNEQRTIDLNKKLIGMTSEQKQEICNTLKQFSGDVLMDFAKEGVNIDCKIEESELAKNPNLVAYYDPNTNTIHANSDASKDVLAHELSHAVNWCFKKQISSGDLKVTFEHELKAYKAKGFEVGANSGSYAAKNSSEMFAECYALVNTGNCNTTKPEMLVKYFPKTLALAKEQIDYVRTLPDEDRR